MSTPSHRFPPPWRVDDADDATEARWIAANIAKLPALLGAAKT